MQFLLSITSKQSNNTAIIIRLDNDNERWKTQGFGYFFLEYQIKFVEDVLAEDDRQEFGVGDVLDHGDDDVSRFLNRSIDKSNHIPIAVD